MRRTCAIPLLLVVSMLVGSVLAQQELPVTVVMPDGSYMGFTIELETAVRPAVLSVRVGIGGSTTQVGQVLFDVGGAQTPASVELVARADLVDSDVGMNWRFTLKDGRTFFTPDDDSIRLILDGTNEFGVVQTLVSYADDAQRQAFRAVIFDPLAVADTVSLLTGDVLSGSVVTPVFTLDARYGTLNLERDWIRRIEIGGSPTGADLVLLRSGDRLSGMLLNETVEVRLAGANVAMIDLLDIGSITFAAP